MTCALASPSHGLFCFRVASFAQIEALPGAFPGAAGCGRAVTGGDDLSAPLKLWHLPCDPEPFALSPAAVSPLLQCTSPQPKRRQEGRREPRPEPRHGAGGTAESPAAEGSAEAVSIEDTESDGVVLNMLGLF